LMKTYQDVLLGRARLEDAAAALDTPGLRQLAFEMAVGVCDADGVCNEREKAFLEHLRAALGIAPSEANAVTEQADALANAPVRAHSVEGEDVPPAALAVAAAPLAAGAAAAAAAQGTAPGPRAASVSDAEIDSM
ncbi:hypothetical protein, partial [Raoultella sp. 18079]|uniref:hypothetical protein n=1 Tax=Raoultella sp. 18079 TaxID=2681458 RepID=UPI00190F9EC2